MDWVAFLNEQWVLVSILAVLLAALAVVEKQRAGKQLSFHDATRMVNNDEAIIVDLRDGKEYSAGHIVDALNIPYPKLKDRIAELEKHKSKTLILVDKMGQHAGAGFKVLSEQGFECARLQGGMLEWQNQNLPVVKA